MVSTIGGSTNVKAHPSRASIGILRSPRSMRLLTICVREFPSDDVEAFLFSGTTVFDPYKLKEMEEDCKGIEPIMVGDIEGDSYDAADPACMNNIRFVERAGGPLKVWAGPDNSEIVKHRYVVSCDIGGSHKTSDPSDIVVLDRCDEIYGGVPEIVAEWHGHCDADQLAMLRCAQIAHFYNDAYRSSIETIRPIRE